MRALFRQLLHRRRLVSCDLQAFESRREEKTGGFDGFSIRSPAGIRVFTIRLVVALSSATINAFRVGHILSES